MKVAMGCDHAGQSFWKKKWITLLKRCPIRLEDFGCPETWPQDYPDVALSVAALLPVGITTGILICGTESA